jgi:hypothetical protein
MVAGRREPFRRFVHRTMPLLVAALVAILLASSGGRARSKYPAVTTYPSLPADARNVLLIVWGTVRTDNLSLHGYGRKTSPNLTKRGESLLVAALFDCHDRPHQFVRRIVAVNREKRAPRSEPVSSTVSSEPSRWFNLILKCRPPTAANPCMKET